MLLSLAPLVLLLVFSLSAKAEPYTRRLTIYADAGRMECYYQHVAATELISLEYQVIHGGHAEPHINFMVMDPKRLVLITEEKRGSGVHNITALETGSYKICFDNTISTFNSKIITFHLKVLAADYEEEELRQLRQEMHTHYHFDRLFNDIHDFLSKISLNLMKARQLQDFLRAMEARDRNVAESSIFMVTIWSSVQFVAMIVVGLLQVFMLRSIFQDDSRLQPLWQRL